MPVLTTNQQNMKTKITSQGIYNKIGNYLVIYKYGLFGGVHYHKTIIFHNYKVAIAYFENL